MVGTRPSESDRIDRECFKRLHLTFHGGRWLFRRYKMKSMAILGYHMGTFIFNDRRLVENETQQMDEETLS